MPRWYAFTSSRASLVVIPVPASASPTFSHARRLVSANSARGPDATNPSISPRRTLSCTPCGSRSRSSFRFLTHPGLRDSRRAISSGLSPVSSSSAAISQASSKALVRPCRRSASRRVRASTADSSHTVPSTVSCASRRAAFTCLNPSIKTHCPASTTTTTGVCWPVSLIVDSTSASRRFCRAQSPAYRRSNRPISNSRTLIVDRERWTSPFVKTRRARDASSQICPIQPAPCLG